MDNTIEILDTSDSDYEFYDDELVNNIHKAILDNNLEEVINFLSQGVNINIEEAFDMHLTYDKDSNDEDSDDDSDEESEDSGGESIQVVTPLMVASRYGRYEITNYLLMNGADVNSATEWGLTPIFYACSHGHLNIVKLLLLHNTNPNVMNAVYYTPLAAAMDKKHRKIVEELLKYPDLDVTVGYSDDTIENLECQHYDTIMNAACEYGWINVVDKLIDLGGQINTSDAELVPLHIASSNGNLELVQLLLSKGAKINILNEDEETAIMQAACYGHIDVVAFLLYSGAKIYSRDNFGKLMSYNRVRNNPQLYNLLKNWKLLKYFYVFNEIGLLNTNFVGCDCIDLLVSYLQ